MQILKLADIKEAALRLKGIVHNTPVLTSRTFNQQTGYEVYFKCENFQRMGAFKFRGAYNALSKLSESEKMNGVITHSSGNHAQAIALAGHLLSIKTVIVMPKNAPQVKIKATRGYGAEIIFSESTPEARKETTHELTKTHNYAFIHPYDNINVIEGAGTACFELISQIGKLNAVLTPVGGGGLLSGTSIVAKESHLVNFMYGVEPLNADDAFQSFKANHIIPQTNPDTIADGLRTSLSELTFSIIKQNVDDFFVVTEYEILKAMKFLFERMKMVVEPSGAVTAAALMHEDCPIEKNSKIGVIISGGNIDMTNYFDALNRLIE